MTDAPTPVLDASPAGPVREVRPRVQLIRVIPSEVARVASWSRHVARLAGTSESAPPAQAVVLWQLTAANHRVLARCAVASVSVDEARRDVLAVVESRVALTSRMVRLEDSRVYGWALLDRGSARVTCARWYTMERDRRESLRMARLGLDALATELARDGDIPISMARG